MTDTTSAEARDLDPTAHEDATDDADLEEAKLDTDEEAESEDDEEEDEEAEEEDADEADEADDEDAEVPANGAGKAAGDLFRESEIAADYVEGLLDILDYDGDIDELVVGGRPVVEVVEGGDGRRLQALVGQRGATLEALQELSRLAVFRQTGSPSRLLLDVAGYRAARRKELAAIAKNAAEKVKEYGEPVRLEAMSAFERKCVHDVINALAGVESESEGVEPARRIVVRPV